MTNESLKELILEKFKGVDIKLDAIHEQAVKTNSRVFHLEEFRLKAESAIVRGEEVIKNRVTPEMLKEVKTEMVSLVDDQHLAKCPQQNRIRAVEDALMGRNAINMWLLRAIAIAASIATILFAVYKIHSGGS